MTGTSFISHETVDVGGWHRLEEDSIGASSKITLVEPSTNRAHIFKQPREGKEHMIWSELLSSFIAGDLLGWEVQRAGLATWNARHGNLLAYFYDPEWKGGSEELFEGVEICTFLDPNYDLKLGKRHTLLLLKDACDLLGRLGLSPTAFWDFWARVFAFDSLISNPDRHAGNWAVIMGPGRIRMAPLYDNGSSLGCRVEARRLENVVNSKGVVQLSHLESLRRKGRHHVRIGGESRHGSLCEEVNAAFLDMYPSGRKWFEAAAEVDLDQVREQMETISRETDLDEPYRLTERRRCHICAMLKLGRERVTHALLKRAEP